MTLYYTFYLFIYFKKSKIYYISTITVCGSYNITTYIETNKKETKRKIQ